MASAGEPTAVDNWQLVAGHENLHCSELDDSSSFHDVLSGAESPTEGKRNRATDFMPEEALKVIPRTVGQFVWENLLIRC